MGIDRPEDGDTPDDAPAPRPGRGAGPLSDPSARMAEQAWYRGTVEKLYAAARDAWAEAVPGLRAAWAKHEQHYPERTRLAPRAQPDGSWSDGGTRELTPEHNAELLYAAERGDTMFDFVPIGEDEATRIVERIRGLAAPDE